MTGAAPVDVHAMAAVHAAAAEALPFRHVRDFLIDGRAVASGDAPLTPVIDPATGATWGSVPEADERIVGMAVDAARAALPRWAATPPAERAEALRRMAAAIERRAEALAVTNTLENGSPRAETGGAAANAASILRVFADMAWFLEEADVRPFPQGANETLVARDPIGVCALIAPWNFPINLVVIKLAPALLAGCTVVVKPAPSTPLSIRFIVEAAEEAGIPPGVVNLITGGTETGDALVRHPGIDKVAFTGSTPVGRHIASICGGLLRPVTLELGGKSSAIVLPGADLNAMSASLVRSCLRNTGQTCYISTRIIATPENYDAVVEMAAATLASSPVGDPLDAATVFGPLASAAQRDRVRGYVRAGVAEGARVVVGGDVPPPIEGGAFLAPTLFADVRAEMTVAREEIFGPVLTILPAASVDEAVAIANDTPFGLGGIVFGPDEDAALDVARRMDTGSVGVNFFASNHHAPFGGRHDSGLGVEYGVEGLSAYLTVQSVHRRRR